MVVLSQITNPWKKGLIIGSGVILAGLLGYLGWKYQHSRWLKKNPDKAAEEQSGFLISAVSRMVVLPTSEKPTIATVSDTAKLGGMAFFTLAEEGDKVLVYKNSGRAVLYRPGEKKVVEVVSLVAPTNVPTVKTTSASITILNGTDIRGLATTAENKLKNTFSEISVKSKNNTVNEYKTSTLYIINKQTEDLAKSMAGKLNIAVGNGLPTGELPVDTDLVLILGEDFR